MPELTETQRDELRELAWVHARMLLGVGPDEGPFSLYDHGLSEQERRKAALAAVTAVTFVEAELAKLLAQFAFQAVSAGASLAEVGRAYGISRQAAAKRWPTAVYLARDQAKVAEDQPEE